MQQLQAMAEIFRFEHFRGGEDLRCAQAELGVFARAVGPAACALAQ